MHCGQDMDRALWTGHFFTLHINELNLISPSSVVIVFKDNAKY